MRRNSNICGPTKDDENKKILRVIFLVDIRSGLTVVTVPSEGVVHQ